MTCVFSCQFLQSVKSSAEAIPDLQSHDELSELTVLNATLFIFRVCDHVIKNSFEQELLIIGK